MDNFNKLVKDFDIALKANNPGAYQNLASSNLRKQIEQAFSEMNVYDTDLFDLFEWKSGIKNEGGCLMMLFGELLTLESITESYHSNDVYDKSLIPLISDNGEEMLLFNSKKGKHYGNYIFTQYLNCILITR